MEVAPIGSEKSSERIVELMKEQPKVTIKDLSKKMGVSTRAIEKHIKILRQNNKIVRKGSRTLGVWEVIDN